jgi:CheY-like chemotaxis protein
VNRQELHAELHAEPRAAAAADGGSETILLAEDEPQVAELAARILHDAGYRVVIARDGDEAVAIGKALGPTLDLLVADVVMPRCNGSAAAAALRALRPGLPALYMSGYAVEILSRHGVDESSVCFLAKPFTAPSLLRAVRHALVGTGSRPDGDQTSEGVLDEPGASRSNSSTAASSSEELNGLGRNRSAAWRTGASSA